MTARAVHPAAAAVERQLRSGRRDWVGIAVAGALLSTLVISLAVLLTLLLTVFQTAVPVFAERGLDFLAAPLSAQPSKAGIGQAIVGSLVLIGFVLLVTVPLGIATAVYLEEYAGSGRFAQFVRVNVRNLAGVPAIVYGLLGLAIFVTFLGRADDGSPGGLTGGRTLISGGLTLAILVLPIVVITTAESLRSVPAALREAAFGVGATRWEATRHQVLPAALPGILTGTVLTLARAFGETAPLIMVGAVTGVFRAAPGSLIEALQGPFTALPTIIFAWSREVKDEFKALTAAAIVVLVVLILVVNATAIILRNRYDRPW